MQTARATQTFTDTPVTLHVCGVEWTFAVASVTRVGRDLFIQVQLTGPDTCGVTMHLRDRVVLGVTAESILMAACSWLQSRGSDRHGYVDLAERAGLWGHASVA